jgi:hypothetical protein
VLRAFLYWGIMVEVIMENEELVSKGSNPMKMILAFGGMIAGLTLMIVGLILSAISYFDGKNHDNWVLMLLVAAFVCLGFGAHGFDLLHQAKRREKERKLNL